MSLNGSGTYVVNSAGQPVVASTLITAAAFNAFTADIATALSTAVFKDGQQTITANLPMGGFRLTGVGSGNSSRTMSASTGDIQDNLANWAGTAGGTANALTLTPTPAITAYLAGQSFVFKAGAAANTSTTTVAISGLTAIAVQANGAACAGGELQANRWYRVTLDSTTTCQVEPLGVNAPAQGGTGVANNAASTITISGAFPLTVTLTASTGVTFPTTGTLITTSGTETLTNKTVNLTSNTLTGTTAQFNTALSDNDFATLAGTETLTNKTVNLTSNTLTGTTAQFNASLSDNDFATLAGIESLTNKKLGSLTTNGFVKTSGGDGTLSVDTSTYLTSIDDGSITTAKLAANAVTQGKISTSTGSAVSGSGGGLGVVGNPYSFAPSVTADSNPDWTTTVPPQGVCYIYGAVSDPNDQTFRMGVRACTSPAGVMTVRWRYINSSMNPAIWVIADPTTGEVLIAWESEDGPINGVAPILYPERPDLPAVEVHIPLALPIYRRGDCVVERHAHRDHLGRDDDDTGISQALGCVDCTVDGKIQAALALHPELAEMPNRLRRVYRHQHLRAEAHGSGKVLGRHIQDTFILANGELVRKPEVPA